VGKVAFITGGDSGIGRAVALAFAREGADILISYFNEAADAQETVRVVEQAGRKAIAEPGAIGDEGHCQQFVERVVQEVGRLDILVNNAAFQMDHQRITKVPSTEFDHTLPHQRLRPVLPLQGRAPPHEAEPGDHQHDLY
jgi:NAD(P)-dependent dehydrogenase (short-subunit alcohol dehydrogenase family)